MKSHKEVEQSLDKIENLITQFEKNDPFLDQIETDLEDLKSKILAGLEEDERIKMLRKAS